MAYFVTGSDGNQYGPVEGDVLQQWVREGRVLPSTMLKDAASGRDFAASSLPGLFQPAAPQAPAPPMTPPPGTGTGNPAQPNFSQPNFSQAPQGVPYPRQSQQQRSSFYDADPFPWKAFIYPPLSLVWFFAFGGLGLIWGGYGIYYAIQTQQSGSKYGLFAVVWSICCFVGLLGGYALGLRGMMLR